LWGTGGRGGEKKPPRPRRATKPQDFTNGNPASQSEIFVIAGSASHSTPLPPSNNWNDEKQEH
jgi:hypothetical protein